MKIKVSRRRQKLVKIDGEYLIVHQDDPKHTDRPDILEMVFLDGKVIGKGVVTR